MIENRPILPVHSASTAPSSPSILIDLVRAHLLGLVILGIKWALIDSFGSEVPFGDQWPAEIEEIYVPHQLGELTLERVAGANNEHRIVTSNLLNLSLIELTGHRMDPKVQTGVSAVLHASWFALVWLGLSRAFPQRSFRWVLLALLLGLGIAPVAYENTLWGFQSQIYLVLLFWAGACWGLCLTPWITLRWWAGLLFAGMGVFSFGAGGLVGIAFGGVVAVRAWTNRKLSVNDLAGLVVSGTLVASGLLTSAPAEHHAALKAASFSEFLLAVTVVGSWPASMVSPLGLTLWFPGLYLFIQIYRRKVEVNVQVLIAVFCLVLAAANVGIISLYRGHVVVTEGIAPRYLDILAIGLIGNVCAFQSIAGDQTRASGRLRVLAWAWLAVVAFFLSGYGLHHLRVTLPFWHQASLVQEASLRSYLLTGDRAILEDKSLWEISHPNGIELAAILDAPETLDVLPIALSDPLNSGSDLARYSILGRAFRRIQSVGIWMALVCLPALFYFLNPWRKDR